MTQVAVQKKLYPVELGEAGVTNTLYPRGHVRRYGALSGGADDTNAIRAAVIAATAAKRKVKFEAEDYLIDAAGTEMLLVQGACGGFKGKGLDRTRLLVKSTVGAAVAVIRVVGDGAAGFRLEQMSIIPQAGAPASIGVNLDVSANVLSYIVFDHAKIGTFGSYAIQCTNTPPNIDGLFTTAIKDCYISGGINFAKAGDSLRVLRSTITGPRGLVVDLVYSGGDSAHLFQLEGCNITCDAGVRVLSANAIRIQRNNFEQPNASTEANSAMIDLDGTVGTPLENVLVSENFLGGTTGNVLSTVRVNYAKGATFRENLMVAPGILPTYAGYRITANAIASRLVDEYISPFGILIESIVQDLGTGTTIEYSSPSGHNPRVYGAGVTKILHHIFRAGSAQSSNALIEFLQNDGVTNILKLTTTGMVLGAAGSNVSQIRHYTPALVPTNVGAAGVSEQTFAVAGLVTTDRVIVTPPAPANAANMVSARVSAADTLAILFMNPSAGVLAPTSGTYKVTAISI